MAQNCFSFQFSNRIVRMVSTTFSYLKPAVNQALNPGSYRRINYKATVGGEVRKKSFVTVTANVSKTDLDLTHKNSVS